MEIQVGDEDVNKVHDLTMKMIPGLTMKDKFQGRYPRTIFSSKLRIDIRFGRRIPGKKGSIKFIAARDTSLADIFEQLEKLKQVMPIRSVSMPKLNSGSVQIFGPKTLDSLGAE